MKNISSAVLILILALPVSGQDLGNVPFIHSLDNKEAATFEDAVTIFMLSQGKIPADFSKNLESLIEAKLLKKGEYNKDMELRRGMFALMIARYLDLGDSLMYIIFETERYALNACIAYDIMGKDQSEWDRLSGVELIEIMTIVDEMKGEKK